MKILLEDSDPLITFASVPAENDAYWDVPDALATRWLEAEELFIETRNEIKAFMKEHPEPDQASTHHEKAVESEAENQRQRQADLDAKEAARNALTEFWKANT
jgi:hypothetical protein